MTAAIFLLNQPAFCSFSAVCVNSADPALNALQGPENNTHQVMIEVIFSVI